MKSAIPRRPFNSRGVELSIMVPTVECCLRNVTAECRTAARRRGIELSIAPCRERCDACRAGPFVLVDGDLRTGAEFATLLDGVETASSDDTEIPPEDEP